LCKQGTVFSLLVALNRTWQLYAAYEANAITEWCVVGGELFNLQQNIEVGPLVPWLAASELPDFNLGH
jgi:hypothetical protein